MMPQMRVKYFARKHPEIIEFQLGSDDTDTDTDTSKCSLNGLQTVMSLPNLTSVKINRKIQPIPDQSIFNMLFILSSRLTTLGLYNLENIPEESILVLLHSCSSRMKTIHLSGNSNITDVVLLKIFQKFGNHLNHLTFLILMSLERYYQNSMDLYLS